MFQSTASHPNVSSQNSVTKISEAFQNEEAAGGESKTVALGLCTATYRNRTTIEIPIYGTIPAGLPDNEQQEPDGCISVDVDSLRLPKGARVFALKVRGDSMVGAGILPGDVVLLEFREARNGEVVAALLDGETTLKRYVVQRGRAFLKAENPRFKNLIPAHELVIQGVQVGLLRILKS